MLSASTIALATYLENAALEWMHLPDCTTQPALCFAFDRQEKETPAVVAERIRSVATDVAALLRDEEPRTFERPIWDDDTTSARTGLLLMHVAFYETRFRGYVADGRCNDTRWRETPEGIQLLKLGTCDGRRAYSLWQIHPEQGFWLTWDGSEVNPRHGDLRVDADSLHDQKTAIMTALHMLRKSVRSTGGLRWYTGEWTGDAPKADVRLKGALAYERRRPFLPEE